MEKHDDSELDAPGSSETRFSSVEADRLLESDSTPTAIVQQGHRSCRIYIVLLALAILNLTQLALHAVQLRQTPEPEHSEPWWLPPERHRDEIFEFHTIYGDDPSDAVEQAWTSWIPCEDSYPDHLESCRLERLTSIAVGKGFVRVSNESDLPGRLLLGIQQSLPEKRAIVSVFHQLHCLVSHFPSLI
jgi:hypothetical protein